MYLYNINTGWELGIRHKNTTVLCLTNGVNKINMIHRPHITLDGSPYLPYLFITLKS